MSAIPQLSPDRVAAPSQTDETIHDTFLKFLPAVETHARIQFRRLPAHEREVALAEARAAAFVNVHDAVQQGKVERLTASTVAHFAVLHVKDGRHVGGRRNSRRDVLSAAASSVSAAWTRSAGPSTTACPLQNTYGAITCFWTDERHRLIRLRFVSIFRASWLVRAIAHARFWVCWRQATSRSRSPTTWV